MSHGSLPSRTPGRPAVEPSGTGGLRISDLTTFGISNDSIQSDGPLPNGVVYAAEVNLPKDARKEYEKGYKALTNNDLKGAEQHFLRAAQMYPRFSSAFVGLGVAYKWEGDVPAAQNAFQSALQLNPNNADAQRNVAELLIRDRKIHEAEKLLLIATALDSQNPEGLVMLAFTELRLKEYDRVLFTAKKMPVGTISHYPYMYLLCAQALEAKGDAKKAAEQYRSYLKQPVDPVEAQFAREHLRLTGTE